MERGYRGVAAVKRVLDWIDESRQWRLILVLAVHTAFVMCALVIVVRL